MSELRERVSAVLAAADTRGMLWECEMIVDTRYIHTLESLLRQCGEALSEQDKELARGETERAELRRVADATNEWSRRAATLEAQMNELRRQMVDPALYEAAMEDRDLAWKAVRELAPRCHVMGCGWCGSRERHLPMTAGSVTTMMLAYECDAHAGEGARDSEWAQAVRRMEQVGG